MKLLLDMRCVREDGKGRKRARHSDGFVGEEEELFTALISVAWWYLHHGIRRHVIVRPRTRWRRK